jgi:hypothetical protein
LSIYTDARSQPGQVVGGSDDDRELFMVEFGQLVLLAWEESNQYSNLCYTRSITQGKADTFPIIGRKRDATEHTPGELITGGTIEHNEVEITVDRMVIDSAFIAEIDELLIHYELAGPYAKQLGESLGSLNDKRCAIMHILASRVTTAPYVGGPVPSYAFHANMRTDPAQLEAAHFAAAQYLREREIGEAELSSRLPHAQALLLARYSGVQGGTLAAGVPTFDNQGRRTGTPPQIAGISITPSNHLPTTNIASGLSKYQGDFTTVVGHISTPMAVGRLKRRGLRVTMDEQSNRLGTLLIASELYGYGKLRNECSFELNTVIR